MGIPKWYTHIFVIYRKRGEKYEKAIYQVVAASASSVDRDI